MAYCLCDGVKPVIPCNLDSKSFLEHYPRGAYTTARTVEGGDKVFDFETHVERLASSLALMYEGQGGEMRASSLRPQLMATMGAAILHYRETYEAAHSADLRLTVLCVWDGKTRRWEDTLPSLTLSIGVQCYCHVGQLPSRPLPPILVEVRGAPRSNARAKDSQWVRDRKALEAMMAPEVNEVLLQGEGGELLEGTQTNFFCVMDDKVWTAQNGILEGTVRRLVLEACEREGIVVELRPPLIQDLLRWQGAFLTSTSRLLLPIDCIRVPASGQAYQPGRDVCRDFDHGEGTLVHRLSTQLSEDVISRASTSVLPGTGR